MSETRVPTILVVDDEVALRDAIAFDFKRKGFQVLVAASGSEAFKIIQTREVDVVLSDVRMPGGDGMELLKNIKSLNPETPVVMFITGFADMTLEEAYDEGAVAVFSKPFDRKELHSTVQKSVTPRDQRWCKCPEKLATTQNVELHLPEPRFGSGGMFISMQENFPIAGAPLEFAIRFEHHPPGSVEGSGIVRWVRKHFAADRPPGCGVEFCFLSESCRKPIIERLKNLKTKSFIPRS